MRIKNTHYPVLAYRPRCHARLPVYTPVQGQTPLDFLASQVTVEGGATEPKAVFMTASEIHAKLKMWGNIEKPMPPNKFGECLRKAGYKKKCLHSGQKGYVVKIHDNLQDIHGRAIRELIEADRADSTF